MFEVERDLRVGTVLAEAIRQLADYVRDRSTAMGARYVGVLSDGVDWLLFHLDAEELHEVSHFTLGSATMIALPG